MAEGNSRSPRHELVDVFDDDGPPAKRVGPIANWLG